MKSFKLLFAGTLLALFIVPFNIQAQLKNIHQLDTGVFRGSKPIDSQDYEILKKDLKIKTLLDLRVSPINIQQEMEEAEHQGMQYMNIPLWPIPFTAPLTRDLEKALNTIIDPAQHPIYFHCHYGDDRTGLIAALYRIHAQGWTYETAYMEMLDLGFKPYLLFPFQLYLKLHSKPGSFHLDLPLEKGEK